jgi:formylglycine-generating enzyme required for sulfatase activity
LAADKAATEQAIRDAVAKATKEQAEKDAAAAKAAKEQAEKDAAAKAAADQAAKDKADREAADKAAQAAKATPTPAVPVAAAEPADKPKRSPGLGAPAKDDKGWYADLTVAGVKQRFRWCVPGAFTMGSPESEDGRDRDETQHQVTLTRGFWIADTECAQELWQAVMGEDPSTKQGERLPVNHVSRDDCQHFCAELAKHAPGLRPRLPWEAEWEYAARAGGSDPFPGAARIDKKTACFDASGPREVASFPPNAWGLYDMAGNVAEWCADRFSPYAKADAKDPQPAGTSDQGVARGGYWEDEADSCRSAKRHRKWPNQAGNSLGLRLVVDAAP